MALFTFHAMVDATIKVVAPDEDAARELIADNLNDADTDFIRTDHWKDNGVLAQFLVVTVTRAEEEPDDEG